jgi:hypothetical protein
MTTMTTTLTVAKTSAKGALLITDGTKAAWIKGSWMRADGSFTPAAYAAMDKAFLSIESYLNPNRKVTAVRETEKAIAVAAESGYYNHVTEEEEVSTRLLWIPRSMINEKGEAPKWFIDKKLAELSEGNKMYFLA